MTRTELPNSVSVTVEEIAGGFRPSVTAPDVYTGQLIVHAHLGRKLPYKTEAAAMKAGVKYANEHFAHIIDPVGYWA